MSDLVDEIIASAAAVAGVNTNASPLLTAALLAASNELGTAVEPEMTFLAISRLSWLFVEGEVHMSPPTVGYTFDVNDDDRIWFEIVDHDHDVHRVDCTDVLSPDEKQQLRTLFARG